MIMLRQALEQQYGLRRQSAWAKFDKGKHVRLIWDIVLFVVLAAGLGLGSAYLAIDNADRIGLYQSGPWRAWPDAAGPNADPYNRAKQARSGVLLLGAGEGLAFTATTDNNGTLLEGGCQYRLQGGHLPARLWTLTLETSQGELVDNASKRYGFHSHQIMRRGGTQYEIVTSPNVMGGNWLQSPAEGAFRFVLRLYETPLTSGGDLAAVQLPEIKWVSCQ